MTISSRALIPATTVAVLLGCVPASSAQTSAPAHVVPLAELHERSVAATEARQKDLLQLDGFFSSEQVSKALRAGKLNGEHLRQAAALLDNAELSRLAERSRQVQSDFAAGVLTNQELTYIVIALATAVVILVIVVH